MVSKNLIGFISIIGHIYRQFGEVDGGTDGGLFYFAFSSSWNWEKKILTTEKEVPGVIESSAVIRFSD